MKKLFFSNKEKDLDNLLVKFFESIKDAKFSNIDNTLTYEYVDLLGKKYYGKCKNNCWLYTDELGYPLVSKSQPTFYEIISKDTELQIICHYKIREKNSILVTIDKSLISMHLLNVFGYSIVDNSPILFNYVIDGSCVSAYRHNLYEDELSESFTPQDKDQVTLVRFAKLLKFINKIK